MTLLAITCVTLCKLSFYTLVSSPVVNIEYVTISTSLVHNECSVKVNDWCYLIQSGSFLTTHRPNKSTEFCKSVSKETGTNETLKANI